MVAILTSGSSGGLVYTEELDTPNISEELGGERKRKRKEERGREREK